MVMGKMGEGQWEYRLPIMERTSHGAERDSIGDIANGIVGVLYGDRW